MTFGEEFFRKLVAQRSSLNVEGMFELYHEGLVKTGFGAPVEDKASFRVWYAKQADGYEIQDMSLDYFAATDDVIIYKATMKTNHGLMKPNEALYLLDGKVYRHLVFTLPPEQLQAWVTAGMAPPPPPGMGQPTPAEQFLQDHLGYIARGEVEVLLREHYHDDAELVTFEGTLKGKDAIRKYLIEWPQFAGNVLGTSTEYFEASGDIIQFKATFATEKLGILKSEDAFYLVDGKIRRQMALSLRPAETKEWAYKGS